MPAERERERDLERICHAALERPVAERARFLMGACGSDEKLRQEVESLLAQEDAAGAFLEAPALAVAAHEMGATPGDNHTAATHAATIPAHTPGGDLLESSRGLAQRGALDGARLAPGQIFGARHRIVSLLGRGAMGEVYRAEDLKLGQPVALKLIAASAAQGDEHVRRSLTEVRLAREIAHPNVCRVYDIGEAEGWCYISMEFVDGETLESLLRRIGRLPGEKAIDMTRQLCAGLAAAHDRGVLHLDLKPSNIMVDARGRIRILDFGLAVPSGEWTVGEICGTPAYMAPEQLVGGRATERTDLYALGLVLYELSAGRPLFSARTVEERQKQSVETTVAPFLPGLDAAIERIVRSCLARDPAERPASVLAIAGLLPGGDPIAAAMAEGRVPSPEMVAAAGPRGALHPAPAWGLLGAILAGTLAVATQVHVMNAAPSDVPKPPEVLAERARTVLAGVGVDGVAADSAFWFTADTSGMSLSEADRSAASAAARADRTNVRFVYRQSPRYLVPQNLLHFVTDADPPSDVPGMATVTLDALGRLVRFARVPQQPGTAPANAPEIDWAALFGEAGLDKREFVPVEPDRTPVVRHDTQLAWNRMSAMPGPFHVTAATLDGKAVQFEATSGGAPTDTARRVNSTGRSPAGETAWWSAIALIFAAAAALARHNVRLRQVDQRGARLLALFVVGMLVVQAILRGHHAPIAMEEIQFLVGASGWALVWGGFTWLMYLSLEPSVRRLWPRTLISWTRLLSGRVCDPLVGRDVLLGALGGIMFVAIEIVSSRATRHPSLDSLYFALESLESTRHFTNTVLLWAPITSLESVLAGAFILVLTRLIVRKTWIAASVTILLSIAIAPGRSVSWGPELIWMIVMTSLRLAIFMRVGLVAYFTVFFTHFLLVRVPITLDPDAWYFGNSLVVLLIVAALAIYGFVVSLGGRSAFGGSGHGNGEASSATPLA